MGVSYSNLPKRSSHFNYFALTFRRPDKIKLLMAGQDVVGMVLGTLSSHWMRGVPKHKHESDECCYDIRVPGLGFGSSSTLETALKTKSLCCALVQGAVPSSSLYIYTKDIRFNMKVDIK
uniref:Uncharacterized protein n=1 Tax=Romanomermis culicivorax TaxID=13658 RepID=A0A915KIB3_ROMCU